MKKQVTRYFILLLLASLFVVPGVTAYLLYQHPNWVNSTKVNKGILLNSPIRINSLGDQSKWQLILWSPGLCKQTCLKQLDMLGRVRLALGRRLYEVEQQLILSKDQSSITEEMKLMLKKLDFHTVQLSIDDKIKLNALSSNTKIFIATPDNFLVLGYLSHAKPEDIYKDLKLLLNVSKKRVVKYAE